MHMYTRFDYKWVINDFSYHFQPNFIIKSSILEIPGYPMTAIIGLIKREDFLRDATEITEFSCQEILTTIQITVDLESDLIKAVVSGEVFILTPTGETAFHSRDNMTNTGVKNKLIFMLRVEPFTLSEGNLIKNDTMTIRCVITIISKDPSTIDNHLIQSSLPEFSLAGDFAALAKNPKYSDVTITVGTTIFDTHKLILTTRSSVFAAMFENKVMKENEKRNIDITDIREEVVEDMLRFIYTDTAEKLGELAIELLSAAEKYDLKNLKILCAQSLQGGLTHDNGAELLIIADRYNLKEMKEYVLKFINTNRKEVMKTNGYKITEKNNPNLLLEALEMFWRK